MSLSALLSESFRRYPERLAFCCGDRTWTYAELDRTAERLAAGFSAQGIAAGDRVAFLLPNGLELVLLYLACCRLGAVAVPLNSRLTGPELAYNLRHCGARLCIAHSSLYPVLIPQRDELPGIERFFLVGPEGPAPGTEAFERLFVEPKSRIGWSEPAPEDPVVILYTSGTTAHPKGVTHTQRSLARTVQFYAEAVQLEKTDVVLGMLSLAHVFGFTLQFLSPLGVGATVVASPGFEAGRVFKLIAQYRVTHLYGLPVMFDSLTQHPGAGQAECRSLRYCLGGGDTVTPALSARMRQTLGVDLHEACGMTEVIPYCINRPGFENRIGTIGPPSVGMSVRLVDANGLDMPDGETGEIRVRSEALMVGYWNDPAATAEAMDDGWFRTGDLGRRDDAGYIHFVGRRKEIIVCGGSNISPLEVEAVLSRHPRVREAAVVGAPDPVLGEAVAAFVVPETGSQLSADELLAFAAAHLAQYKLPSAIFFLDDLPRGTTGKVYRKALKARVAGG